MRKPLAYQREFSNIPGLQKNRTVRYALTVRCGEEGNLYGARVTEVDENRILGDESCFFTDQLERAEWMLTFLYENAIPTEHCISIISDLSVDDWVQWEENHGTDPDPAAHCG